MCHIWFSIKDHLICGKHYIFNISCQSNAIFKNPIKYQINSKLRYVLILNHSFPEIFSSIYKIYITCLLCSKPDSFLNNLSIYHIYGYVQIF